MDEEGDTDHYFYSVEADHLHENLEVMHQVVQVCIRVVLEKSRSLGDHHVQDSAMTAWTGCHSASQNLGNITIQ